ncbi:hypothetical protein [Nonomuraea sp. NPDC046570]|uniref:hypothetical protein n=1 Tax=Nonomuraea sp. NPDC046570 TaxID=3155255 RepID=UPI0033F675AD
MGLAFLVGMAFFLQSQAANSAPRYALSDVETVSGEVATSETAVETGYRTRRVVNTVTLKGHPQLRFTLTGGSPKSIVAGDMVRFEALGDLRKALAAERNPNASHSIEVVGVAIDGQVVFSAADEIRRAESAVSAYRWPALLCGLTALTWAGLLLWRHRAALAALRERLRDAY